MNPVVRVVRVDMSDRMSVSHACFLVEQYKYVGYYVSEVKHVGDSYIFEIHLKRTGAKVG